MYIYIGFTNHFICISSSVNYSPKFVIAFLNSDALYINGPIEVGGQAFGDDQKVRRGKLSKLTRKKVIWLLSMHL
jgi:hypothetical protein